MNNDRQDISTLANTRLIIQAAEYYSFTASNLATYQEMEMPTLETLAAKHLLHWKEELRHLVLNRLNCTDERLVS